MNPEVQPANLLNDLINVLEKYDLPPYASVGMLFMAAFWVANGTMKVSEAAFSEEQAIEKVEDAWPGGDS